MIGYDSKVFELAGEGELPAGVQPLDVAARYLDWQIAAQLFTTALVVRGKSALGGAAIDGYELPMSVHGAQRATEHRDLLIRKAVRGFEVLFGSDASPDEVQRFFASLGYIAVGEVRVDAFFHQAPTESSLRHAFDLMVALRTRVAVCFAHDNDPAFIVAEP